MGDREAAQKPGVLWSLSPKWLQGKIWQGCSGYIHFLSKQWLKAVEKTCLLCHTALKVCPQPGSNQIKPDLASISGVICFFPLNFGFAIQHGRSWLGFCDPLPCCAQRSLLRSPFFLLPFVWLWLLAAAPHYFSHHNWGSSNIATVGHRLRIPCNESLWHLFPLPREFASMACPALQRLLRLLQQSAHCVMMGAAFLLCRPPRCPPQLGPGSPRAVFV